MREDIEPVYAPSHDITFILKETYDDSGEIKSTEVTGFYYGEPKEEDVKEFNGKLKAEY